MATTSVRRSPGSHTMVAHGKVRQRRAPDRRDRPVPRLDADRVTRATINQKADEEDLGLNHSAEISDRLLESRRDLRSEMGLKPHMRQSMY